MTDATEMNPTPMHWWPAPAEGKFHFANPGNPNDVAFMNFAFSVAFTFNAEDHKT